MRFLAAIFVIAVVCAGSMYFFNPTQFNGILTRVGVTSWQAPGASTPASGTTTSAVASVQNGAAAATSSAVTPQVTSKTN